MEASVGVTNLTFAPGAPTVLRDRVEVVLPVLLPQPATAGKAASPRSATAIALCRLAADRI
jgi:hypothetical protein